MKDFIGLIDDYKEAMIDDIKELVAIPSVANYESYENAAHPFGIEVQRVYDKVLSMAERDGFSTKNVDNQGGHIDFQGKTDDIVAIVGHLDIVPAGDLESWETDPFEAVEKDGYLVGRGVLDDKGPFMAGYYAMKALKEAGFQPTKTIRAIIGLDEEDEWRGMEYYMEREKAPVAGFSPDAEFPAIHAEKGLLIFKIEKQLEKVEKGGTRLVELIGGTVANAVADQCKVKLLFADEEEENATTLRQVKEYLEAYLLTHSHDVRYEAEGGLFTISVKGKSAHASTPELGLNAISIMFEILGGIRFNNEETNKTIAFYNQHMGFDYHGERIGAHLEDVPSGNLAFNVGLVNMDEERVSWTINVRYPVTFQAGDVYDGIEAVIEPFGFRLVRHKNGEFQPPLYKSADDPLVKTLMNSYQEFTGDYETKPLVIGGATYARAVPNTIAFGPVMPGEPDPCHQPNESVKVDDLVRSAKIFARALYELAK